MSGDGLFGRFLGRVNEPLARPENTQPYSGAGLQMVLDHQGAVLTISGAEGNGLAVGVSNQQPRLLLDYLVPGSTQALEGGPFSYLL